MHHSSEFFSTFPINAAPNYSRVVCNIDAFYIQLTPTHSMFHAQASSSLVDLILGKHHTRILLLLKLIITKSAVVHR